MMPCPYTKLSDMAGKAQATKYPFLENAIASCSPISTIFSPSDKKLLIANIYCINIKIFISKN
jgi:hypothetical protein